MGNSTKEKLVAHTILTIFYSYEKYDV